MSFHDPKSDVSRLNREAHLGPVTVQPETYEVLTAAEHIARCSEELFDITVARELTSWHYLPSLGSVTPDPEARWGDIELLSENRVRFRRPLWIDLGGISKGFAVEGSLASSCGSESARLENGLPMSVHVDGRRRTAASPSRFVCIAAQECVIADALSKIVLLEGLRASEVISQFHAQACLFDESDGWSYLGSTNAEVSNNDR